VPTSPLNVHVFDLDVPQFVQKISWYE